MRTLTHLAVAFAVVTSLTVIGVAVLGLLLNPRRRGGRR